MLLCNFNHTLKLTLKISVGSTERVSSIKQKGKIFESPWALTSIPTVTLRPLRLEGQHQISIQILSTTSGCPSFSFSTPSCSPSPSTSGIGRREDSLKHLTYRKISRAKFVKSLKRKGKTLGKSTIFGIRDRSGSLQR